MGKIPILTHNFSKGVGSTANQLGMKYPNICLTQSAVILFSQPQSDTALAVTISDSEFFGAQKTILQPKILGIWSVVERVCKKNSINFIYIFFGVFEENSGTKRHKHQQSQPSHVPMTWCQMKSKQNQQYLQRFPIPKKMPKLRVFVAHHFSSQEIATWASIEPRTIFGQPLNCRMILGTSVIQIQNFKLVYPTSKRKAKTPNPKNIGLAWVLHIVDHFVAAVYEGEPVRALDFGFRMKMIWSLDFGDNKTAIFGTLQQFVWKLSVSLYPSRLFWGGPESAAVFFSPENHLPHLWCANGVSANQWWQGRRFFAHFFFSLPNSCRFRGYLWCLTAVAEFFFFKNGEVPMDADVEFEFGGVYRLGPKCCCMKWPMTLLWRLGGVKPSFHQG